MSASAVIVLGPQRLVPTVRESLESVPEVRLPEGRIALITAGWEEREEDDDELCQHIGVERSRGRNLRLFQRAEAVFQRDPELFEGLRQRHDRMRNLQGLYRLRLSHALEAARELLRRDGSRDDARLLEEEREEAIAAVRTLDANHLRRLETVHAEFEEEWRPLERDSVRAERDEIRAELRSADALCVAGGHVTILLNRLRLFGLAELIGGLPLVAWSAGAMALSERVVVFHDSPPQGPGDAEVLEVGLGLLRDLVALPHASRRLRLDDPVRVGLFARRFGPALCAALDARARIDWNGTLWRAEPGTQRLREDGQLVEVGSR